MEVYDSGGTQLVTLSGSTSLSFGGGLELKGNSSGTGSVFVDEVKLI